MKKNMMYVSLVLLLGATAIATAVKAETPAKAETKKDELIITDIKVGTGAEAVAGKRLSVQYTGWLYDEKAPGHKGKKIDSSRDHNNMAYSFVLGKDQVIKGWDQGLLGMKAGGQRGLVVPGPLGYGAHGAGDLVPPNSKLVFDVELLEVN